MKNKKKLKTVRHANSPIYVNDDLTQLRSKMLKVVKEKFRSANTVNGKIVVYGDAGKRTYIESPDDFFRVDITVDDDMLKRLGLESYLVSTSGKSSP